MSPRLTPEQIKEYNEAGEKMTEETCANCGFREFNHPVENVFIGDDILRVACKKFKPQNHSPHNSVKKLPVNGAFNTGSEGTQNHTRQGNSTIRCKNSNQSKQPAEKSLSEKFILDATCGGRYIWFNKNHPNTLYIDNRKVEKGHDIRRKNHQVKPDIIMDNSNMPFKDKTFKLIVLDMPYFTRNEGYKAKSSMVQSYGYLDKDKWREQIKGSFDECWRVLENYGVLIFKWNTMQIKKSEVLEVIGKIPLFGHTTKNYTNTIWFCFMKIPDKIMGDNLI